MAELWALLHFIMPSMFDSHDEFNEWFSKDIESHAENKTSIDEREYPIVLMLIYSAHNKAEKSLYSSSRRASSPLLP
jgi:SNF2 family N-terminal domain.